MFNGPCIAYWDNSSYQRSMYNENSSFRRGSANPLQNPCEAREMNFILQRSTGTQMVGKMLRASILHNPDKTIKTQITL